MEFVRLEGHPGPSWKFAIPLFSNFVVAGFPSPADNEMEASLSLEEMVIRNPACTFYVRVRGDSMSRAGLRDGDILIVDRSIEPANGHIAVVFLNGESTVKRLHIRGTRVSLLPESEDERYIPIVVDPNSDRFDIFGVVIASLRKY